MSVVSTKCLGFGPAMIQVSGTRYTFDPARPVGPRIVSSEIQPERRYVVAMEGQVVQRQTASLAGRFKKLKYTTTDVAFTKALYGYAAKSGKIESRVEGRVRQAGSP